MGKWSSQQKKKWIQWIILLLVGGLIIGALSVACIPIFQKLSEPQAQAQLETWIRSLGVAGWIVFLILQIAQIVIALIPGEPIELLAGVLYGTWGGLFTCLLGILIASTMIFFTVRRFGYPLVARIFGEEKLSAFRFLNDNDKIETLTFILFLLPGIPKDVLTYLAGISKIRPVTFLLLSTFARIPSVITSTMMGASVSQGRFGTAIFAFVLTAIIGIAGLFYKEQLFNHLHKKNSQSNPKSR